MTEPVHLHTNRLNRNVNVFLLLIPTIVFIFVLALLYINYKVNPQKQQIAVEQNPETAVLGEESGLDNSHEKVPK